MTRWLREGLVATIAATSLACGSDGAVPAGGSSGSAGTARDAGAAGVGDGSGGRGGAGGAGGRQPEADSGGGSLSDAGGGGPTSVEPTDAGGSPADGGACAPGAARFVTGTLDHAFGPGSTTGQADFPRPLLGPPRGAGCCQGSFDVVSLGNGGFVVVEFEGNAIVDGPGADFIVFENAFWAGGDETEPFAELATVSVSEDGEQWHRYECTAVEPPYGDCAGWHPVFANADDNDIDPLDPSVAGGDAFDLADLGVARARFVRIEDRVDLDGFSGTFDLDAVGIVNAECP